MPLVPGQLTADVLKITDAADPGFIGFPTFFIGDDPELGSDTERTNQEVADNWANAVGDAFKTILIPPIGAALFASKAIAATSMKIALDVSTPPGLVPIIPSPVQVLVDAFGSAVVIALPVLAITVVPFIATPTPPIEDPAIPALNFEADIVKWFPQNTFTLLPAGPAPWS